MAAITQRINNFLGGVSKLSDDQKLPGQVRECINGFIDPTFGLTKRPGTQFLHELSTASIAFTNSKWFWFEKQQNRYVGVVYTLGAAGGLFVWDVDTGKQATINDTQYQDTDYTQNPPVTVTNNASVYLNGMSEPAKDFKALSIQDTTILLNRLVVADVNAPTPTETALQEALTKRLTIRALQDPAGKQFTFRVKNIDTLSHTDVTFTAATHASFKEFF